MKRIPRIFPLFLLAYTTLTTGLIFLTLNQISKSFDSLKAGDYKLAQKHSQTARTLLTPTQALTFFINSQIINTSLDLIDTATTTAQTTQTLIHSVLNNQPQNFTSSYQQLSALLPKLNSQLTNFNQTASTSTIIKKFNLDKKFVFYDDVKHNLDLAQDWLPLIPDLLGVNTPKSYIILFQNNFELRPTGGFIGSYARIDFDQGTLKKISIQDIYVPDGQLVGYVQEPEPISKYLFRDQTPGWRLRDSNWDPAFTDAASDINWFFNKGKEAPNDGLIAINLITIHELLSVVGPINVIDYNETINTDNFYPKTQTYAEVDFFPGSIQKQSFLSSFAKNLIEKIKTTDSKKQFQIAQTFLNHLNQNQILISLDDLEVAQKLTYYHWDGHLINPTCDQSNCVTDYLYLVEANVGINKANCCIDRSIDHQINISDSGKISSQLTLNYTNHNSPNVKPPRVFGGNYKNYLRLILPPNIQLIKVKINNQPVGDVDVTNTSDNTIIGFLSFVPAQEQQQILITYNLTNQISLDQPINYQLDIQKQSGIASFPYSLTINHNNQPLYQISKDIIKNSQLTQIINLPPL